MSRYFDLNSVTEPIGGYKAAPGVVTLTSGAAGSVNDITVDGVSIMDGAEAFDADLETTAQNVVDNINGYTSDPNYGAERNGTSILIYQGVLSNVILAVVADTTTIEATTKDLFGRRYGGLVPRIGPGSGYLSQ